MGVQMSDFIMPKRVEFERVTLAEGYGKFVAEPLERGFGTTIGNSLRRVLLSSIAGAAVTQVRMDQVLHEFSSVQGVIEDVTDVILNLKKVRVRLEGDEPRVVTLDKKGPGEVTAGDIQEEAHVTVLNVDQHIATVGEDGHLKMELTIKKGRGYVTAELNKEEDSPIGIIPMDAVFSPIIKVNYSVENARVGQATDYDRLIMEIWTDGSVEPQDALAYAAKILKDHLSIFINFEEVEETVEEEVDEEKELIYRNMEKKVGELELSVRSANCLKNAEIKTIRDLIQKTEAEMLKTKNFGRKSLNEIKEILTEMGLNLGMDLSDYPSREKSEEIEE